MKILKIVFVVCLALITTGLFAEDKWTATKNKFSIGLTGAVDNTLYGEFGGFLGLATQYEKNKDFLPVDLTYGLEFSGTNLGYINTFRTSAVVKLNSMLDNGFSFGVLGQAGVLLGKDGSLGKILRNAYDLTAGVGFGYTGNVVSEQYIRYMTYFTYSYSNIGDLILNLKKNRLGVKFSLEYLLG